MWSLFRGKVVAMAMVRGVAPHTDNGKRDGTDCFKVWAHQLAHKTVLFQCDNTGVVAAMKKGTANEELVMHLLRSLWFFVAHYDISVSIEYIAGAANQIADQLSRYNMQTFFCSNSQISFLPTPFPAGLLQIVAASGPSPTFRGSFSDIITRV